MPKQNNRQKVIAIVGPTASGKTALSIKLAKKFSGEIISADSRQIYKGMDIGTGKVTKREMRGVPHHMISIISPKKDFSAGEFAKRAKKEIEQIVQRERLPIVVGGTGFYADALLGSTPLPDVPPNAKLRKALNKKSASQLFTLLKKLDPRRAKTIDPYNAVRLIRALEIAKAIGRVPPLKATKSQFDVLWLGLATSEKELGKKIHTRLLARLNQGMVAEAKRLHGRPAGISYMRMESLGLEYRYLAYYLQNKISKEQFIEQLGAAIRNYAKRQMRYLHRNKNIIWIKNEHEATARATSFLRDEIY